MEKIIKFKDFKKEELGCLMLYFDINNWSEYIRELISEEDIYLDEEDELNNYGYEDESHCTILYGFHHYNNITNDIKVFLPEIDYLDDIQRTNITIFENENYDVVKFDVKSKKLIDLNKKFINEFEYTNDYLDYLPHITIAYVKKGLGKKYINENMEKISIFGKKYIYSDHEYTETEI